MDYFWIYLLVINIVAGIVFAWDKYSSMYRTTRVPERTLHILEFLGGWISVMILMPIIHHKNSKRSYHVVTIMIAVLWLAAAGYFIYQL